MFPAGRLTEPGDSAITTVLACTYPLYLLGMGSAPKKTPLKNLGVERLI
jgi:hypothetical protein